MLIWGQIFNLLITKRINSIIDTNLWDGVHTFIRGAQIQLSEGGTKMICGWGVALNPNIPHPLGDIPDFFLPMSHV